MRLLTKLFVLLALVSTVEAAESPYYLSLSGNYYQQHTAKAKSDHVFFTGATYSGELHTKYDPGYGSVFALGYKYDQWRFEIEGFYRQHEVDKYETATAATAWDYIEVAYEDSNDKIKSYGSALNAYYDWSIKKWKPYLGFGIGLERDEYRDNDTLYTAKNTNLVYQFMAGLSHPITDSLDLFSEYRLFSSFGRKKYEDNDGDYVRYGKAISMLNLGVRYHF